MRNLSVIDSYGIIALWTVSSSEKWFWQITSDSPAYARAALVCIATLRLNKRKQKSIDGWKKISSDVESHPRCVIWVRWRDKVTQICQRLWKERKKEKRKRRYIMLESWSLQLPAEERSFFVFFRNLQKRNRQTLTGRLRECGFYSDGTKKSLECERYGGSEMHWPENMNAFILN